MQTYVISKRHWGNHIVDYSSAREAIMKNMGKKSLDSLINYNVTQTKQETIFIFYGYIVTFIHVYDIPCTWNISYQHWLLNTRYAIYYILMIPFHIERLWIDEHKIYMSPH